MKMRVRAILELVLTMTLGLRLALAGSPGQTEAEGALSRHDWAAALPLCQQVEEYEKGNKETWAAWRDKVAECKKHLTGQQIEQLSWTPGKPPPGTAATLPARKEHAAPTAGEVRSMGIKELGNFPYDPEKGGGVPADVQKLSGMKVRLWGFMIALQQTDKITDFALVPSLTGCCYGQPPGVEHTITIHLPKDQPTAFTREAIAVEGTLKVAETRENDYTISLFEVEHARVERLELGVPQEVLNGKKNYLPPNGDMLK